MDRHVGLLLCGAVRLAIGGIGLKAIGRCYQAVKTDFDIPRP